ncbi:MAG: transglycosylase SLT domain-containing protein, partial [Blastocatellia bacterium]
LCSVGFLGFTYARKSSQAKTIDLLPKIEEARKLVATESVQMVKGVIGTRQVKVGRHKYREEPITGVTGREMALAVMDPEGVINVIRAVRDDSGLHVKTPGFFLYMRRENGINSDIACEKPAGGRVLAIKYPVSNEGARFGPGPDVLEAVYTPYSGEIKTEEVVLRGVKIQQEFVDKAYAKLRQRDVLSRAFEGRFVAEAIPKNIMTVLLINEHIDPGDFTEESVAGPLADRVLTVIGTNREKAYLYSISSAGAHGLVQMMPSTYYRIAGLYSAAGLMSSFTQGMTDPVNAIMAQVLLCDSDWHSIRQISDISASKVGPYLAAAYNGGVGRVLSVLSNDQADWMEDPESNSQPTMRVSRSVPVRVLTRRGRQRTRYVVKTYTEPIFRAETNKYVRQYHWIATYLDAKSKKAAEESSVEQSARR